MILNLAAFQGTWGVGECHKIHTYASLGIYSCLGDKMPRSFQDAFKIYHQRESWRLKIARFQTKAKLFWRQASRCLWRDFKTFKYILCAAG